MKNTRMYVMTETSLFMMSYRLSSLWTEKNKALDGTTRSQGTHCN